MKRIKAFPKIEKNKKFLKKYFFSAIKMLTTEELSETRSLKKSTTHPILKPIFKYRKFRKRRKVMDKDLDFVGTELKML